MVRITNDEKNYLLKHGCVYRRDLHSTRSHHNNHTYVTENWHVIGLLECYENGANPDKFAYKKRKPKGKYRHSNDGRLQNKSKSKRDRGKQTDRNRKYKNYKSRENKE